MSGLNKSDLDILGHYARHENRELYWNYLAQKPGNDGYGLLALGVVRNDSTSGQTANTFAASHTRREQGLDLTEVQWNKVGVDLMKEDLAQRVAQFQREQRPDLALNLPALKVRDAHNVAFDRNDVPANAWTPNRLVNAAFARAGEPAAERVWSQMLDDGGRGLSRVAATTNAVRENASHLDNPKAYLAEMTAARVLSIASSPTTNPDRIRHAGTLYQFTERQGGWLALREEAYGRPEMFAALPSSERVTDAKLIATLDATRQLRMEQRAMATQFHPGDPYREIAKSPRFMLSEQETPQRQPGMEQLAKMPHKYQLLHEELKGALPPETSEDRLSQIVAQAHIGGVQAGQIRAVHLHEGSVHVLGEVPGQRAHIDLSQAPPTQTQSQHQVVDHDQQQAQRQQQFQQEYAQQHQQSQAQRMH
ncbi:MAG: hypothetical protein Q4G46_15435 [Propionibacteriaceae bacterium]|nr:hypothetical protein [Propionibacteriaceae bacterium]